MSIAPPEHPVRTSAPGISLPTRSGPSPAPGKSFLFILCRQAVAWPRKASDAMRRWRRSPGGTEWATWTHQARYAGHSGACPRLRFAAPSAPRETAVPKSRRAHVCTRCSSAARQVVGSVIPIETTHLSVTTGLVVASTRSRRPEIDRTKAWPWGATALTACPERSRTCAIPNAQGVSPGGERLPPSLSTGLVVLRK